MQVLARNRNLYLPKPLPKRRSLISASSIQRLDQRSLFNSSGIHPSHTRFDEERSMYPMLIVNAVLLWIVVLFNLLLTLALVRKLNAQTTGRPDFENAPTLEAGAPAPEFVAETLDGQAINRSTYHQRAVVFLFVSPSCQPCGEKIATFNRLAPRAKQHGTELVLVSVAGQEETRDFLRQHATSLPVLVAAPETSRFEEDYKVVGTPFHCFVDENGVVKSAGFLGAKWEKLAQSWN
jgi:peroxiredoxin